EGVVPHSMSITKIERALKEKNNPEDDWMKFPLIKIKITSAKRRECKSYNLTSQAEDDDDEDQDLDTRSKRSCAKKERQRVLLEAVRFSFLYIIQLIHLCSSGRK
ncbi:hypothetical protein ATANTOWER_029225, partial [Ataeniobius toweri]|nr:hypothetical protein [Ataeniobius toweri]